MYIYEKYAKNIDAEALAASQKEISENATGDYPEVPVGKYEVKLDRAECKISKTSGNLMVSMGFKILKGEYKNQLIWYNGTFGKDFPRHNTAKFLSDILDDGDRTAEINLILKTNHKETINDFVLDIHEAVDGKLEYELDYGKKGDFNTYAITDVYDA